MYCRRSDSPGALWFLLRASALMGIPLLCLLSVAQADTAFLKSGRKIENCTITRRADMVDIKTNGTVISVPASSIERIEAENREGAPALDDQEMDHLVQKFEGQFVGIGVHIKESPGKGLLVPKLVPGGPAERAGLPAPCLIVKIDGESARDMKVPDAVSRLKGQEGSVVEVTYVVEDDSRPRMVEITRGVVQTRSVEYRTTPDRRGVLTLLTFNKRTPDEFREAMAHFRERGITALAIDLQSNTGGLYPIVCQIAGMLCGTKVPLWQVRNLETGDVKRVYGNSAQEAHWPIMGIIGPGTAGGGTLLALAIRDGAGGVLIGHRTLGKTDMAEYKDTRDGQHQRVRVGEILSIEGTLITGKGIEPDITVQNDDWAAAKDEAEQAPGENVEEKR